jgi:hypothetical protein
MEPRRACQPSIALQRTPSPALLSDPHFRQPPETNEDRSGMIRRPAAPATRTRSILCAGTRKEALTEFVALLQVKGSEERWMWGGWVGTDGKNLLAVDSW